MNTAKWVIRAGVLIVILGFFLPSVMVSCTSSLVSAKSYSLADLASEKDSPLLYLLLLIAVAIAVLTFIKGKDSAQEKMFAWIEGGAMAVGMLVTAITLSTISNDIHYSGFDVELEFGAFVLIIGIIAFWVGWVILLSNLQTGSTSPHPNNFFAQRDNHQPPPWNEAPVTYPATNEEFIPTMDVGMGASSGARLKAITSSFQPEWIRINSDHFTLGRSSQCDLQLEDISVSRIHAELRLVQDTVFIQDRDSKTGVMINGKSIQAARLADGDEIKIGPYRFTFYS